MRQRLLPRFFFLVKSTALLLLLTASISIAYGQSATGTITGVVTDSSGAVVPNAAITITNKATGATRSLNSNQDGLYSAPSLEAGQYQVRCAQKGFKTEERDAEVQAGGDITVNLALSLGEASEVVSVTAATAEMNYESHSVSGVIEHKSIENLPLNGRSFVQLASLQPGVTLVAQSQGLRNSPIGISIFGGGGQYALVTVDGLQINDFNDGNGQGGTAINFSQEVIEEFQLSSANFDLSTFTTIQGAINMVTRSGGNAFHGSAYFFYRDHNLAAYPGLHVSPLNPNPYFVRKNPGFTFSGPILKNKLFFFGSYEYTNQVAAVTVQPDLASIAPGAGIYSSPNIYNYTTIRLDYRPSEKNSMFVRWTHDQNHGFGLGSTGAAFQSNWVTNINWSEQYVFGVTTTVSSDIVNDFRFGFRDWTNKDNAASVQQCGTSCFGGPVPGLAPKGLPNLSMIGSANFAAGNFEFTPQSRLARNFEPRDTLSWQKKAHRLQFGADFDYYNEAFYFPLCGTGCMSVYSVENTRTILGAQTALYAPNLPTTVTTTAELLNLPISYPASGLTSGFEAGPGETPGPYHFASERRDFRPRVFVQDFWKARSNLTINYGLAYAYESGLWPSDMPIPGLVAPVYGLPAGTQQPGTPNDKLNFSPGVGFSYSPGSSGKTVVRGGFGIYYDTGSYVQKLHTIANIGPVGNGPITLPSTVFTNIFPGIVEQGPNGTFPTLPIGASIPTATFTNLTLGQFLQIYNQQYAAINARVTPSVPVTNGPYQYSNVDLIKQASALNNTHNPMPRSYQTTLGIQRELTSDMVLTADWVRREIQHNSLGQVDLNHFSEYVNGIQMPRVPKCAVSQLFVLGTQCSTGAFPTYLNEGNSIYEGLSIRLDKRFSHRYQFAVGYALQNLDTETVVNLNNYKEGYGPSLAHQNLNISGIGNLPWGFSLSLNSSIITRSPVEVMTTAIDLSGTGATGSGPLPGIRVRGLPSHAQLASAVAAFNQTYAGTHAPNGQTVPSYVLPPSYSIGDPQISQDLRLTKDFTYHERYSLALYAEMFNALNIANLTGFSTNLDTLKATGQTYAFGQPTARVGQVFLSSGPRAAQFGARISF